MSGARIVRLSMSCLGLDLAVEDEFFRERQSGVMAQVSEAEEGSGVRKRGPGLESLCRPPCLIIFSCCLSVSPPLSLFYLGGSDLALQYHRRRGGWHEVRKSHPFTC